MNQGFLEAALKMSMALGAVLVVFAACVFAFRKFSGFSQFLQKKTKKFQVRPIEILSQQALGPGRALFLVKCQGKKILIGATNSHIQNIQSFDDENMELDFESSLSEQSDSGANKIRGDMGRSLKDVSRV